MALSLFIEKREWTKDELMTAQKIFCDNDFARDVLESIFKDHATKNAAGVLVFDCGKELNAFSILMNMMGEYLALFFEGYLLDKGYSFDDSLLEHRDELHKRLTEMFRQMYKAKE